MEHTLLDDTAAEWLIDLMSRPGHICPPGCLCELIRTNPVIMEAQRKMGQPPQYTDQN